MITPMELVEMARNCGMFVSTEMHWQVQRWERLAAAINAKFAPHLQVGQLKVETRRQLSGIYAITWNGARRGEAWKSATGRGYCISLKGIYWRNGKPNTTGGNTATLVPRLKDIPEFVRQTLKELNT